MSKMAMIGSLECRAGEGAAMERVLSRMVDAAKGEPGCEIYAYFRGEGETFWFFALMSGEDAMQAHGQTEAMKAAMAEFMPLAAGPPKMSPARPIAALGFET